MNWSQLAGIIRIVGPAAIAVAAQTHLISDNLATNLTVMLGSVLGSAAWSAYANTDLNLSKAVAAVPGLQVHVDTTAPVDLQKAALDRTVADIVPAAPAPFVSSTISQRL